MGILRFFGTLLNNRFTKNAIQANFKEKIYVQTLLFDFNSVIHTSSTEVINNLNEQIRNICDTTLSMDYSQQLDNEQVKWKEEQNTPLLVKQRIESFVDTIKGKIDDLVIKQVIQNFNDIIHKFCDKDTLKTVYVAIDGVPNLAKMIEQRKRRYISTILEMCREEIKRKYKHFLEQNNIFFSLYQITWNKLNISTSTKFMDALLAEIRSIQIENVDIIISDMSEQGEGEYKILQYAAKLSLNNSMLIVSPDSDMVLQAMLLNPQHQVKLLRNNQQKSKTNNQYYDLIDVKQLMNIMINYVRQRGAYFKEKMQNAKYDDNLNLFQFNDAFNEHIIRDLVCINSFFGNDFIPKLETLSIDNNFITFIDIYIKSVLICVQSDLLPYLIIKLESKYTINYHMFLKVIHQLNKVEKDVVVNFHIYQHFNNFALVQEVFNPHNKPLTFKYLREQIQDFYAKYKNIQKVPLSDKLFYTQLSLSLYPESTPLKPIEIKDKVLQHLQQHGNLPSLAWSFKRQWINTKDSTNPYENALESLKSMTQPYDKVFNNQAFNFNTSSPDYKHYYPKYVGSDNIKGVVAMYIQALFWVVNSNFNVQTTVFNTFVYPFKRSPLMRDIYQFVTKLKPEQLTSIHQSLDNYDQKYTIPPSVHNLFILPNHIFASFSNKQIVISAQDYKKYKTILIDKKYLELMKQLVLKAKPTPYIDARDTPFIEKIHFEILYINNISELSNQFFKSILLNVTTLAD